MKARLTAWLAQTNQVVFSIYAITAAFITYFSMYSFRKPFTAGMYEGLTIWGFDYKIIAVTVQIIGYTLSKFLGIKVVSELRPSIRILVILALMGFAWLTLFFFAIMPRPYNVCFLFLNGLPLGMIWGVVFSFLEGRRFTELLGAGMASSFIVSSGIVKATGRSLVLNYDVSEFWMPFLTGAIYIPALLFGTFLLSAIPPPTKSDEIYRTKRVPMDHAARKRFFIRFALGIFLMTVMYVALTVFRDVRDNFAVEIWIALGYEDKPHILATAEIPIAVAVLIIIGSMIFIKNNRFAFYLNQLIIIFAGSLLLFTTFLFVQYDINPALWMILNGFSMYLAYIAYHTFLFERWIALFRYESNIGFLMYIVDAFGYLGSVGILLTRNFADLSSSWLSLFIKIAYATAFLTVTLGIVSTVYFYRKEKRLNV
jgi:hypothetical protein